MLHTFRAGAPRSPPTAAQSAPRRSTPVCCRISPAPETTARSAAGDLARSLARPPICRTATSRSPVRSRRKMMINALNSGAQVFMADFEDSLSPSWRNVVEGQAQLHRLPSAARSPYDSPEGKSYRLNDRVATPGTPARLAPDREARHGRRPADQPQPVRALLLPQRARMLDRGTAARTSTWQRTRAT